MAAFETIRENNIIFLSVMIDGIEQSIRSRVSQRKEAKRRGFPGKLPDWPARHGDFPSLFAARRSKQRSAARSPPALRSDQLLRAMAQIDVYRPSHVNLRIRTLLIDGL
jgi:hypothetical protein